MTKNNLALGFAALTVLVCLKLQLSFGPRWQDALVQVLFCGILAALLWGFVRLEAWACFIGIFVPVALYDAILTVRPPLPASLIFLYTVMAIIAVTVYLSVYEKQLKGLIQGFSALFTQGKTSWQRGLLLTLAPLWFSAVVLAKSFPELMPPNELRTVHPEPPAEITVKSKSFDMVNGTNPYRKFKSEDPEKFKSLVAEGKKVYYRNCIYCHGDNLSGKGHFAVGFNPKPANFQDIGTIAMLQESYVFWRVTKGGPGLPKSGQPWASAMPVWEDMVTEDEIWKAILFIYDGTGHEPRTFAHAEEHK